MAIKKLFCTGCNKLVGAEDTKTGEHEYVNAMRFWNDLPYCKDCYNREVLDSTPFMGGIDELQFE